jgi:hypothetical protein
MPTGHARGVYFDPDFYLISDHLARSFDQLNTP